MEVVMNREGDRAFNEAVLEVQQQILLYKECTNKKLKKLEEMMDLAVQKWSLLKREVKHQEDKFVRPTEWKEVTSPSRIEHSNAPKESLFHHNLQIPKFEGAGNVTDWLKDCEQCFEVLGVSDNKKALIAGMHLEGEARRWYQVYRTRKIHMNWLDFSVQLSAKFGLLEQESLNDNLWGGIRNDWNCVHTGSEPLQIRPPDDYKLFKYFQKSDLRSENGAQYGALVNKEEWNDMDTFSLLEIFKEEANKPSVENNYGKKFEMEEHAPFLNEKKLMDNELSNSYEEEVAYFLNPMIMVENARFWEPNDLNCALRCPFEAGEIEWIQVGCIHTYDLKLRSEVVHGQGDTPMVAVNYKGEDVSYNGEEKQSATEEVSSMFSRELIEASLGKRIVKDSYVFGKMLSNFGENEVLIFDPGGYDSNGQHTSVDVFKNLIRNTQETQGVCVETDGVVSKTNQQYAYSVRVRMKVIPKYFVIREGIPKMDRVMRLEDNHDASRKCVTRTIFDPGGYLNCFYHVQIGGYIKFLNVHYLLPNVIDVEKLHTKRKENIVMFSALTNAPGPGQHLKKLVLAFCDEILLQFKAGQVYMTQLKDSFEVHDPP